MKSVQFLMLDYQLITDKKITSNEFRIYAYLLSLYNNEEKCSFPSIETIASELNISLSTVKRSIKKLTELGYMKIEKKKSDRGFYNIYKNFKNLITGNKKRQKKKHVDSNGAEPIEGQIDIDEALHNKEEVENIKVVTGLNEKKILKLLSLAPGEKILEIYEYSKSRRVFNLYGFIKKAITEGWNIKSISNDCINPFSFNNFEARQYDYDELERKLLGWDKYE